MWKLHHFNDSNLRRLLSATRIQSGPNSIFANISIHKFHPVRQTYFLGMPSLTAKSIHFPVYKCLLSLSLSLSLIPTLPFSFSHLILPISLQEWTIMTTPVIKYCGTHQTKVRNEECKFLRIQNKEIKGLGRYSWERGEWESNEIWTQLG